jgi:hypothetical protein
MPFSADTLPHAHRRAMPALLQKVVRIPSGVAIILSMQSGQMAPKFYIKGKHKVQRALNLEKIANDLFDGNFSAMVNDALNKQYGLDPETGEKLQDCPTGAPKAKSGPLHQKREKY